jgi:hypothetical protein
MAQTNQGKRLVAVVPVLPTLKPVDQMTPDELREHAEREYDELIAPALAIWLAR